MTVLEVTTEQFQFVYTDNFYWYCWRKILIGGWELFDRCLECNFEFSDRRQFLILLSTRSR